jgi:pilus assembly protein CpaC
MAVASTGQNSLFASRAYQKNETDLIIIVTPRIVRPSRPGDQDSARQHAAGKRHRFLPVRQAEVARRENRRGEATYGQGPIGHMLDLPKVENHASLR